MFRQDYLPLYIFDDQRSLLFNILGAERKKRDLGHLLKNLSKITKMSINRAYIAYEKYII
jgi:hypothetical protein